MHVDPSMLGAPVHERAARDFYPTIDENLTIALSSILQRTRMLGPNAVVWEAAAGDGAMTRVLERQFAQVWSSDIEPLFDDCEKLDFLKDEPTHPADAIITNPPYGALLTPFMERGVAHIRSGKVRLVALLARNEVDSAGSERSHLFKNCPEFAAKIVVTWRPRWIKDSKGSPRHNYAWYVWTTAVEVRAANGPQIYYASR